MSKGFHTYEELLKEKQQLEIVLHAQKQIIRSDIRELKHQLAPVREAIATLKKFTTKDKTNLLLTFGSDMAINALVKNFVLSRAGWLVRMVVPYILKNYSSHFLAERKERWFDKLVAWINRRKNGKDREQEKETEQQPGEDLS